MKTSVTVLLEATAKPECIYDLIAMLHENFKETRVYDGCIDVYMNRGHDDPNQLVLVEQWETRPNYETYLAWRTDTGVSEQLAGMLSAPPIFRYFDRLEE